MWNEDVWFKYILDHPTYPWSGLSGNHNLTLGSIKILWRGITQLSKPEWKWFFPSRRLTIKNIDNAWNWSEVHDNPNIDSNIVVDNPDIPWPQTHPRQTMDAVSETLIEAQEMDWSGVIQESNKLSDCTALSYNQELTLDLVLDNQNVEWDWRAISRHANITMDNVRQYPDLPWRWDYISSNPNLDWHMVDENLQRPWNWKRVSQNPMYVARENWINHKRLHIIKAMQIHRHWRCCSWNPEFLMGKRMVMERAGLIVSR
jgi:hypothetical protein